MSISTTLFIGAQYLRDNTIINDSVDAKVLQPIIRTAQTKYIQQVIGSKLYDKLIAEIVAVTISGDYQILLDQYVIPVLVEYATYEAIPFLNFKFRNKSISKQQSDNSVAADVAELTYIRDNVLSTAQFYAERLTRFLLENSDKYHEYNEFSRDLNKNTQNYFNGIHIPKNVFRNRGNIANGSIDYGVYNEYIFNGPFNI